MIIFVNLTRNITLFTYASVLSPVSQKNPSVLTLKKVLN